VGWNSLDPGQLPTDGLGHGTHVAGVLAASADDGSQVAGLTWGAAAGSAVRLLACKFMSDQVGLPVWQHAQWPCADIAFGAHALHTWGGA
jgi:subtilisin family serine protease